jgi:glycosyltransferase involved in cell wall biosynthesis
MIAPSLGESIRYVGVVDHNRKNQLLGDAACVLMPARWDEPFGMVAVEAMACGTPVVVSQRGALPEIVDDGVSGFSASYDEMPGRVMQAFRLDRAAVRKAAARFDVSLVARRYFEIYKDMHAC